MKWIVLTAAICAATPASAKVYAVDFRPFPMQLSRYDRGTQIIDSQMHRSTVRIVEIGGTDKRTASFEVFVLNKNGQSFVFGPDNIVVRTPDAQSLPVVAYEQAMEAERKKKNRERFRAGLAAFGRALDATQEGSVEGSGWYEGAGSWGTFSFSADDPAARIAAEREADRMDRQDQADLQARWAMRAGQHETLLRPTTVDPGKSYGGLVRFSLTDTVRKASAPIPLTISVTIAGESHVFEGQLWARD